MTAKLIHCIIGGGISRCQDSFLSVIFQFEVIFTLELTIITLIL